MKFIFGYEESFGFLLSSSVRDKDAFQPMIILLEIASSIKEKNLTLIDYLENIYELYGYYKDELITFNYESLDGSSKMVSIINKLSNQKLGKFFNMTIISIENYQNLSKLSSSGTKKIFLEKSNVIKYFFKEGGWVVFRPSGTEPKLKIYISLSGQDKIEVLARFTEFKSSHLAIL
jgi:phosphoglucomutase